MITLIKKLLDLDFYDWEMYEYIKSDLSILKNEFKYGNRVFIVDWGNK